MWKYALGSTNPKGEEPVMKMKRLLSALCLVALLAGLTPALAVEEPTFTVQGWFETICAELTGLKDADVTAVTYTDADGVAVSLEGEDFEFLVRDMDGGVRIDIPGVKAGTYSLSVTAKDQTYTAQDIQVKAYDRSGFAHQTVDENSVCTRYTEGVGAYKDDGTLKDNAIVLYVTEENKETVTLTQGFTVTGIGNILNTKGWDKRQSDRNQRKLLQKVSQAGFPIVVRIVGEVTQPTGVTAWNSTDYGGTKGDNGGMCIMEYVGNITIEGIGPDATVNGWGFCFSADGTGRTALNETVPLCAKREGQGENIEVRNLTFQNVPEDCIGINGSQGDVDVNGEKLQGLFKDSAEHVWVHNNAFYVPKVNNPAESDKGEGDGAVDFRNGEYMTLSYNYFEGYHKSSLVGSDDDILQYHVTWHHNWWKNVQSRSPLCRQADMHIYNNLYDGQTSYCMSLRANSYVFSEYNTFVNNCANPVKLEPTSGSTIPVGACKSYQDDFSGVKSGATNQATQVDNKATPVDSTNQFPNFDTAAGSYIATGNYQLDSRANAVKKIQTYAGPMKDPVAQGALDSGATSLGWSYTEDGVLNLTGVLPEKEQVLAGCWDSDGRFAGVKTLDAKHMGVELGRDWSKVKLFWLNGSQAPKCANAEF